MGGNSSKVTHGYWKLRGRGQISRLLLAFTQANWEDVQYESMEKWFGADKEKLGFAFPNLPYVIDDQVKLTESLAIWIYIIERSGREYLLGKNCKDRSTIMNSVGVILECWEKLIQIAYSPDGPSKLQETWKVLGPKFENLKKYKTQNCPIEYLNLADFLLSEVSYYVQNIYPQQYKKLEFLAGIRDIVNSIPQIKAYYEKPTAVKGPFVHPLKASIKF